MDDCFVKDNKCSRFFYLYVFQINRSSLQALINTHSHAHILHLILIFFFASVSLLSKEFPFIEKCLLSKKKKKKHTHILVKVFMKNEANTFWLNIVCMDALDLYCNLKSNQCTILMIRLSVYTHKHKYSTSKSCLDFGFWI